MSIPIEIAAPDLACALNIDARTLRNAVERGDAAFAGHRKTPGGGKRGGHLRWPTARAVEIVRAAGLAVPVTWEPSPEKRTGEGGGK